MKCTALVAVILLVAACREDRSEAPAPPQDSRRSVSDIVADDDPSKVLYLGKATVTEDTWLLPRDTDFKNYARVHIGKRPTQGDVDTWESRQKEGRVHPVKQGTRVKVRRQIRRFPMRDGTEAVFRKVEIDDGSMLDEDGYPLRGHILMSHLTDPR